MNLDTLYNTEYVVPIATGIIPIIDGTPLKTALLQLGYNTTHLEIDHYFLRKYSFLQVDDLFFVNGDFNSEYYAQTITGSLLANMETIERLYEIYQSEYNPVENYDKYEEYDKTTTKSTIGERSSESYDGSVITENKTSGEDSSSLLLQDQTTTKGTQPDNSVKNTAKSNAAEDTVVNSGTGEGGKIVNHIHGNAGTTMTGQILRDHEDFWTAFNFYDFLYGLIFRDVSNGMYEF